MPTTPASGPEADRSAASSTASPAAPDPAGLIADAGPEFDPVAAGDAPPPPLDPAALEAMTSWSESRVKALLTGQGTLLHGAVAIEKGASTEWIYTEADLRAIAPPLTRILNRYPATRAAAASGDELAVVVGFAGYGVRSWSERRRAIAQLPDVEPDEYEPAPEPVATVPTVEQQQDAGAGDDGPRPIPPISSPRRR